MARRPGAWGTDTHRHIITSRDCEGHPQSGSLVYPGRRSLTRLSIIGHVSSAKTSSPLNSWLQRTHNPYFLYFVISRINEMLSSTPRLFPATIAFCKAVFVRPGWFDF
ncbi:hypothetical protein ElyMa_002154500 [Elysia marginata]|uniref:Uncharacterized protein n=1 Tax=Elysia marginata TaxID=1093978 RepID=A0AAV4FP44_9GAST|nr:hypothetical protein ElyMa_002154500 [Elysia marginata]